LNVVFIEQSRNLVLKIRLFMKTQIVFIDTEFTQFDDPKLISIGLAASSGEQFYAEVPYPLDECSEFVRKTVLPLLNKIEEYPYDSLNAIITNWLGLIKIDSVVTLCYDSQFDKYLFLKIFNESTPSFVQFRLLSRCEIIELLHHEFYRINRLPRHHALNDALALRNAYREIPTRQVR